MAKTLDSGLLDKAVAGGAGLLWASSLPLPAFGLAQQTSINWYPGWTLFLGGLAGEWIAFTPAYAGYVVWYAARYAAWWANPVLLFIAIRLVRGRKLKGVFAAAPLALALCSFAIRRFGLPDDDEMPVVAYEVGFWLWLAAMALPLLSAIPLPPTRREAKTASG